MKIIHICKMTGVAGAERHLLMLLRGLRAAGLDADILVLTPPNDAPVRRFLAQAQAWGIPTNQMTIRTHLSLPLIGDLAAFIRAGGYDTAHTHLIHADLHGIIAAKRAGVAHIVSSRHNDDRFRYSLPIRLLNRWLWQRIDQGIAISEWVRKFSIDVEGASADQITTVYYGLDPETVRVGGGTRTILTAELGIPPSSTLVGTVCRLVPQKGVEYALRAFWHVAEAYPFAHFVVAGDGPQRRQLEDLAGSLGLTKRIHFLGWRDDSHAVLAALDVVMVPSLWEGFGLVMLEAMAQRVPVIASQVSAIPEVVIDGETGILVEPGDVDSLTSALSLLLEDSYLVQEMGNNGRARLEDTFSLRQMIDGTRAVYEQFS
jgi:glycosyltransferase involved in cell wall biosynthesis